MITPDQFAGLADQLATADSLPQSEALYRTVIGRWYYAVYHAVKCWLEHRFAADLETANGRSHERISNCCYDLQKKYMDLQFSKLGRLLENLKQKRVRADYMLDISLCKFDVERVQADYNTIIEQLKLLQSKYP